MISIEKLRKIDPDLKDLSDEKVIKIRDKFYELGQFMFEVWQKEKAVPKNPVGSVHCLSGKCNI